MRASVEGVKWLSRLREVDERCGEISVMPAMVLGASIDEFALSRWRDKTRFTQTVVCWRAAGKAWRFSGMSLALTHAAAYRAGMAPSDLRDLLISWANINSGSGHLAGLERMRVAIAAEFAQIVGAEIEAISLPGTNACALRMRQRPGALRRLLLSGHYDTVYGADHVFQRCEQVEANRLRGPGVADMKGGIVVMLAALRAFERSPEAADLGWDVLLTPDEETGSVASRVLIEDVARGHRCALVFEPARENGDLVRSRKGTGAFTITCHGRAAHAGRAAGEGRNAIVALAEFLISADRLPQEFPGVLLNVGAIEGGGAVNVVPELARAVMNIRITRAVEEGLVLERLRTLAERINAREGFRLEIEGRFHRRPMESGPGSEAMFAAWQRCGNEASAAPFSWTHVGGGSDGNLISAVGVPCLDGLGPVGGHLHSDEEYIFLSSLEERAQIAARFLAKFATGEVALPGCGEINFGGGSSVLR